MSCKGYTLPSFHCAMCREATGQGYTVVTMQNELLCECGLQKHIYIFLTEKSIILPLVLSVADMLLVVTNVSVHF